MKVVLVTGSRTWVDGNVIRAALHAEAPDLVIAGGADGADRLAAKITRQEIPNAHVAEVQAKWRRPDGQTNRAAGHQRNRAMVKLAHTLEQGGADVVVLAFMDLANPTPGTQDCIDRAAAARLRIRLLEPELT